KTILAVLKVCNIQASHRVRSIYGATRIATLFSATSGGAKSGRGRAGRKGSGKCLLASLITRALDRKDIESGGRAGRAGFRAPACLRSAACIPPRPARAADEARR